MTKKENKKFKPGENWVWYAPNTTDAFGEKEIEAVKNALEDGWLTVGDIASKFEKRIAEIFGKNTGLFVNSGSSANLVVLESLNFPKDSEIITPACNFNTTVAPIIQTGSVPVFVDVSVGKYTIKVEDLKKALSDKTVAVMAPNLIGNFVDLEKIKNFCDENDLIFIEDSCDTIGGKFKGKPSGHWSDITTTSFYASHVITTGGAGGMAMFDDEKLREKARIFRDWGRGIGGHDETIDSRLNTFEVDGENYDSAFVFVERGYNFKPTEMQAAFGFQQLNRLEEFLDSRKNNFERLHNFFQEHRDLFILPSPHPETETNWLAFPLTVRDSAPFERNDLAKYLERNKIQTRPLFSGNILKHPAYKNIKHRQIGDLENSQKILHNSLLIGLHHGLTDKMLGHVEQSFENFIKSNE